jgi:hypothetical protein
MWIFEGYEQLQSSTMETATCSQSCGSKQLDQKHFWNKNARTRVCLGRSGSVSRLNFRLGPLSFRHCGGMTGALPRVMSRRIFEGNHSYKFIYSGFSRDVLNGRKLLILLVGAGRFERPTPCAQGGGMANLSRSISH